MKIPIRKHTKVRRPKSNYILAVRDISGYQFNLHKYEPVVVQDIKTGLENPLTTDRLQREINDFKRMYPTPYPIRKPSLLTRIKRIRRKI